MHGCMQEGRIRAGASMRRLSQRLKEQRLKVADGITKRVRQGFSIKALVPASPPRPRRTAGE